MQNAEKSRRYKDILIMIAMAAGIAVFTAFGAFRVFARACDGVKSDVLRLHIPANSDSAEDQAIKLRLRDFILEEYGEAFSEAGGLEQAQALCGELLPEIESAANEFLEKNGAGYGAKAELTETWFPTREYDRLILPAGKYSALSITLGSGEGRNWWCVIFPQLCLPAVSAESDNDSENENAVLETFGKPQRLTFKFAVFEWLAGLFS